MELEHTEEELELKRAELARRFSESSQNWNGTRFERLSVRDLELLLDLYRDVFFGKWWHREVGDQLTFSLSTRMTKSAGKTIVKRKLQGPAHHPVSFEIRIGVDFFLQFDAVERSKVVCGLPAPSALWALIFVFEHELCHVIEALYYPKTDCSKEPFKALARRLFGHRSSYHELPTTREIAYQQMGLKVGDKVAFRHQAHTNTGIIAAINKRATVMVPSKNGLYMDKRGTRYDKYYVPLSLITAR
ncbi:MAG TPA: hypothetical protein VJZ70_06520 [Limnochordia bacterium]|nr:hypothetical protein [Limnochordia bacterium]